MVISLAAYLTLLAALAAERIVELMLSSRNARWARARGAIEYGAAHYPAMAAFHALFIVSCAAEAGLLRPLQAPLLGSAALSGALLAQALRYWAVSTLGRRWNTRIIVAPGAAPITSGPYRWLRHPNYLAVVLEMFCVPMIYGCWRTALVFSAGNAILLRVRIKAEEAALGAQYRERFNSVPRLLPSLRRRSVPSLTILRRGRG